MIIHTNTKVIVDFDIVHMYGGIYFLNTIKIRIWLLSRFLSIKCASGYGFCCSFG